MEAYTNNSKINVIKILITNLTADFFTNKEDFILISYSQIAEIDSPDKGNINNINEASMTI